MTAAVFGLVGVVVGAVVTGGIDYCLERRSEKGIQRQAKRLVASELHTVWVHLDLLARAASAPSTPITAFGDRFLPFQQWETMREIVARFVSDSEWEELSLFYDSVSGLRLLVGMENPGTPLPSELVQQSAELRDTASHLYTRLAGRPAEGLAA